MSGPDVEPEPGPLPRTDEDIVRFWDLAQELFCVLDDDARILRVNPAWTRVLGWPAEQLLGRLAFEFVHADDLDATRHVSLAEGADGQRLEEFHNRYRHRDGSIRWLSWTGYKRGSRWYGVARDVTATRLSHDALQRSERRSRATLQALREGLLICDARGRVIEANMQFAEMIGLPLRDIVGCQPPYPWWPPEDAERIGDLLAHAIRGRRDTAELMFMRRDGTRFPVVLDDVDLPDRDGRTAILTVVRDISELVEARDRLAEAHRLAGIATWEYDPHDDRIVIHADPLRDGPQETWTTTGAESLERVAPSSRDELARLRLATARGELDAFRVDVLTLEPDRWMEIRGQTVTDIDGQALGARGTAHEITDRKLVERTAELQDAALDLAGLAVLAIDPAGCVDHLAGPAARLLGREPGELMGTPLAAVLHGAGGLQAALGSGEPWAGAIELRDPSARVHVRTAPVRDATGAVSRTVVVLGPE